MRCCASVYRGASLLRNDNFIIIGNRVAVAGICRTWRAVAVADGFPFESIRGKVDLATKPELIDTMVGAGLHLRLPGNRSPPRSAQGDATSSQNRRLDPAEVGAPHHPPARPPGGFSRVIV